MTDNGGVVTPEQRNQPGTGAATDPPTTPVPAQRQDQPTTPSAPPSTDPRPTDPKPVATKPAGTKPAKTSLKFKPTRVSGTWVAVIVAAIVLVFLLIFILQNLTSVTVHFIGVNGTLPLGVALLLATVAGALLVALVGGARILQLRRIARKAHTRSVR